MSWYRSKVDLWLGILLLALPLAVIMAWIAALTSGSREDLFAAVLASVLTIGILGGLVYPMRYGVNDEHLIVRFGVVRTRIPLAHITSVTPTRNPLASPALSMDRLSIVSGPGLTGAVMISPADRDRFLDELAARAGLKRIGDRLERG